MAHKDLSITEYKRLSPSHDISAFFGEEHGWPTVAAYRDGACIGAISTVNRDGMVICGPLRVSLGSRAFVALRLIEQYDQWMREMGIVCYYVGVDVTNSSWDRVMKKITDRYSGTLQPLGDRD
ncbi:MAG: hypothetical protein L0220_16305, partial [Acidobacteria bacterium]|nr:hypothetical protein [Acidobacteriota bacterium]